MVEVISSLSDEMGNYYITYISNLGYKKEGLLIDPVRLPSPGKKFSGMDQLKNYTQSVN